MENPWEIQGQACLAWWKGDSEALLTMTSRFGSFDVPVGIYFRSEDEMPEIETFALSLCSPSVLEVGAGTGSHTLALQQRGHRVTAIDIDPILVSIMHERGISDARQADIFRFSDEQFDTILMLMNGIGVAGDLKRLPELLDRCKQLLTPQGKLIFDSSDLFLDLQESADDNSVNHYPGEVWYTLSHKNSESSPFPWLFLDEQTMSQYFADAGWQTQIVYEDADNQYLVVARPL